MILMKIKGLFKKINKNKQESIVAYGMILPAIVLLIIFVFIPLIIAIYRSFFEKSINGNDYVGLYYYLKVFKNSNFIKSIGNVLLFAITITLVQIVISFIFANILVRIKNRFGRFARTIIYIPYLLSGIVVSVIFTLLITYNGGVLNSIIEGFGHDPIAWNNDKFWSPISIIVPSLWIGFGYTSLVMYAGLINIPKEYFEAAQMDGANVLQSTFKISIPFMKNYFILLVVSGIAANLQMYEIPMIMTNGQPLNRTMTPVLYIMHNRSNGNVSDSEITAMAILIMIIILLINSVVFYLFKDRDDKKKVR